MAKMLDNHQEQLVAKETTQNTTDVPFPSSTSTSSDRLDELTNMLDSSIEQHSLLASVNESIDKETERVAMLAERMMEPPLSEPPMMEPPMMELPFMASEQASATCRRRTRYTPLPRIMENAVYLAPSACSPTRCA